MKGVYGNSCGDPQRLLLARCAAVLVPGQLPQAVVAGSQCHDRTVRTTSKTRKYAPRPRCLEVHGCPEAFQSKKKVLRVSTRAAIAHRLPVGARLVGRTNFQAPQVFHCNPPRTSAGKSSSARVVAVRLGVAMWPCGYVVMCLCGYVSISLYRNCSYWARPVFLPWRTFVALVRGCLAAA